jgi:hypothetical protein
MPSFLIDRKLKKYKTVIESLINGNVSNYTIKKSDYSIVVSLIRKRKDFHIVNRFGNLILKYVGHKEVVCS